MMTPHILADQATRRASQNMADDGSHDGVVLQTPSAATERCSVATHLISRLHECGVRDMFAVPGDYTLSLLDAFLDDGRIRCITTCTEQGAGYAADGYSRSFNPSRLACVVVTYNVGGFSVANAIAGCFAENRPVLLISGAPGTRAYGPGNAHLLHHTLGDGRRGVQAAVFSQIAAHVEVLNDPLKAAHQIDVAIEAALAAQKPVYLELPCDLVAELCDATPRMPLRHVQTTAKAMHPTESEVLAATEAAAFLDARASPVLIAGPLLAKNHAAIRAFEELVVASGYGFCTSPSAKGSVLSERQPQFIGTYMGAVSVPDACRAAVESAEAYVLVGCRLDDVDSCCFSLGLLSERAVKLDADAVTIGDKMRVHDTDLAGVLRALALRVRPNGASVEAFKRLHEMPSSQRLSPPAPGLRTAHVIKHLQAALTPQSVVCVDMGDSFFLGQQLKLPHGAAYQAQPFYGSIGWATPCTLGLAIASPLRRVITLTGDGALQETVQELATMLRYKINAIIVVLNNGQYAIETAIHGEKPYNDIANFQYSKLIDVFTGGEEFSTGGAPSDRSERGSEPSDAAAVATSATAAASSSAWGAWGVCCTNEGDLIHAFARAAREPSSLAVIECVLDPADITPQLRTYGKAAGAYHGRPYIPADTGQASLGAA